MARKVTEEDKILINELYIKLKTYAAVARETGFSPTTVKKYIITNYIPKEQIQQNVFNIEIPAINKEMFDIENFGELCILSKEEKIEVEELWKELLL
jgi:hypothetical protein